MEELIIYTDGASRGNPGPAGIGVVVTDPAGKIIREVSAGIGMTTNNVAEYQALLRGMTEAKELAATRLRAYADSELMVKQMSGIYQVKNEGLKPYYDAAQKLRREFAHFSLEYIPREENKRADALSKQGSQAPEPDGSAVATEVYPVRFILASGTKGSEGMTVIYERDDGKAGRVMISFPTDLDKIRFVGDGASLVTIRSPAAGTKRSPEIVELIFNRNMVVTGR
ncbi:MAG: ribonuclease HI family protein [bacterium]|jgi:ribonuclease HI